MAYPQNQMVRASGWLMISLQDTNDEPGVFPSEDPTSDLPETPTFSEGQFTGQVVSGHTYTFVDAVDVRSVQFWVPEVGPDISYRVGAIDVTDPANPVTNIQTPANVTPGQWNTQTIGHYLIEAGTVLHVVIEVINSASSQTWSGDWVRGGDSNAGQPGVGNWNRRTQNNIIRFNKTDNDSNDRSADLASVIVGSDVTIASVDNAAQYVSYHIGGVTNLADTVEFDVALTTTGPGGEPFPGTITEATFTIPNPAPAKYVTEAGYLSGNQPQWATMTGLLELNNIPQSVDGDSFGIRLTAQRIYKSADWDVMALSPELA